MTLKTVNGPCSLRGHGIWAGLLWFMWSSRYAWAACGCVHKLGVFAVLVTRGPLFRLDVLALEFWNLPCLFQDSWGSALLTWMQRGVGRPLEPHLPEETLHDAFMEPGLLTREVRPGSNQKTIKIETGRMTNIILGSV